MNKGLPAFIISGLVVVILVIAADYFGWRDKLTGAVPMPSGPTTFTQEEVDRLLRDWPNAMAEVEQALKEYKALGGSYAGENAIRRGVQAGYYDRMDWAEGRAEYLVSYLFMLRNSLLKGTEQHAALLYFMEHYERNDAVSTELKDWQIDQIQELLKAIEEAPAVDTYPSGDVELMRRNYERFHSMLVTYGQQPAFAQNRRR